ncbi:DUF4190 domain-containing protein [Pengzhenrongella frigida]|uniref:DUF4190 domain-containing protein n=1 Tax=Pengzhenrongella frigida TaxID=1259133 RepID=A0A4Q5N0Q5_9MICO|nr:DUF4190 domain-containing protein [Cellulomonas sp. HLT2-17]
MAALVTGVLGLGLVAVVLGIAALVRIGRDGTRGRWLAIAGVALGTISTLVVAGLLVVAVNGVLETRPLPPDVTAARDAHARQLVTGNCLDPLPDDGEVNDVRVVPCTDPHAAQVISQYEFESDAIWPGQAAADRRVATACQVSAAETEAGLTPVTWAPTEQSWEDGDRTGLCLLHRADGTPLTGSLLP